MMNEKNLFKDFGKGSIIFSSSGIMVVLDRDHILFDEERTNFFLYFGYDNEDESQEMNSEYYNKSYDDEVVLALTFDERKIYNWDQNED